MKGTSFVGEERDDVIRPMAEQLMNTGVKEKDAYHVVSAIYAGCEYFISTDVRLSTYVKISLPDDDKIILPPT